MVGLDVVAGFVAMLAEVAQQKAHTVTECKSPSKKAFVLGLIALGCLLAAHFIAVMIGCIISDSHTIVTVFPIVTVFSAPKITQRVTMACIYLTWIVATAGAGILTMGIWMNRESRLECGFTNKQFLSLGGKVCFLHAIVSVVMYLANFICRFCIS
ncbi:unnamed protein product [Brassica napus]|uniref:(rape) hypothetical protein n=1 Tax=Brassica napus TaxID=3708 RepID=A0A816T0N3_BRANA|nr:unnamed protein product [Brassica napus]